MVTTTTARRAGGKVLRLRLDWRGPWELTTKGTRAVPPGSGGIYVIQDRWEERRLFPVAYAGQAQDLRSRIRSHARGRGNPWVGEARRSRDLLFSWASVSDPNLRSAAEAMLVWIFQPRYNAQVPLVSPFPITLPPYKE